LLSRDEKTEGILHITERAQAAAAKSKGIKHSVEREQEIIDINCSKKD